MFAASKTGGVVASSGDPYWTSVSLLTNFENNLTFQDGSTNNFAITRTGVVNPSLNTPFSGGVGGSEKFNGSTGYLSTPSSSALDILSGGDFTVECWFYANAILTNGGYGNVIASRESSAGTDGWEFRISPSGIEFVYGGLSANLQSFTFSTATWYHVVAQRTGSAFAYYINGVKYTPTYSNRIVDSASALRVGLSGASAGSASYFSGNISNLRITKGTAVYVTNFTPPTAPLTAITNTSLLITGTGQGMYDNSTFVDQGPNALTVTATGAPVYSGLSPFGNTYPGSVYVPTSSYLQTTASAAYTFTANFTIECFVLIPSGVSQSTYSQIVLSGNANQGIHSSFAGATNTFYMFNIGGNVASGVTSNDGLWHHLAVVRNGSTVTFYVDGISKGTTTTSATIDFGSTTGPKIGSGGAGDNTYQGYISNVRITKGTAVYTANFTPSTTPLTAITNTSLLVRGDTGAFYDLSNNGLAETGVGAPVVTTQVKKFGNESGFLNGSSSYLTVPNTTALQMGTGDYTVEFWMYQTSVAGSQVAIEVGRAGVGSSPGFQIDTISGVIQVYGGATTGTLLITAGSTQVTNQWYYIALTRSGSSTRLFINGTQSGSTATDATNYTQAFLWIGSNAGGASAYLNGYLDDIRITKGVARYTANFTPPTATFPTGP